MGGEAEVWAQAKWLQSLNSYLHDNLFMKEQMQTKKS